MTIPPELLAGGHGGNLAEATARYGTPAEGWLDLSTGINPTPYPARPIAPASLAALPDRAALDALIATARETYQVPAGASLAAVPGSEFAIRLLPLILPVGPVAIVGPTYGSHAEAWATTRPNISMVAELDAIPADATIVVLANPNNPDGRIAAVGDLARLAGTLAEHGGMLVVDEAFADLDPDVSLVPLLDDAPALVLRSFGKFFGLAGLRLGFVVGPPAIIGHLADLIGDWPVSSPAIAIGRTALADRAWQRQARHRLAATADRLRALLARHGIGIAGGTDLFVLTEHPDAAGLHHRLAQAGIWTRAFAYRRDWLRFGLPGDEAGFARLDAALGDAVGAVAPRD